MSSSTLQAEQSPSIPSNRDWSRLANASLALGFTFVAGLVVGVLLVESKDAESKESLPRSGSEGRLQTNSYAPPRAAINPDEFRRGVLREVNERRKAAGLGELVGHGALDQAAEAKLKHMVANDYWSHFSPSGDSPWSFITATGYHYIYVGENLARDFVDPVTLVDAWMTSDSHRENVLNPVYTETGIAVSTLGYREAGGTLVVQFYAKR